MAQVLVKIAGLMGSTGVAAEAAGAHGLKAKDAKYQQAWCTGARFQTMNSIAILALASAPLPESRVRWAGAGLALGTLLFSGGCYAFAILEDRKYSSPAPLGGMIMMASWLSLVF